MIRPTECWWLIHPSIICLDSTAWATLAAWFQAFFSVAAIWYSGHLARRMFERTEQLNWKRERLKVTHSLECVLILLRSALATLTQISIESKTGIPLQIQAARISQLREHNTQFSSMSLLDCGHANVARLIVGSQSIIVMVTQILEFTQRIGESYISPEGIEIERRDFEKLYNDLRQLIERRKRIDAMPINKTMYMNDDEFEELFGPAPQSTANR